jgi:hypothetical protein
MLQHQAAKDAWVHKGLPLVWLSDCYYALGCPALSKRYIMLTACEDAIQDKGAIRPERGVYFRIVWRHGMGHRDVVRYAEEMYLLFDTTPQEAMVPEWILQELDSDWMVEFPSVQEAAHYVPHMIYVRRLLSKLGTGAGTALERLGQYLLGTIPGCRCDRRRSAIRRITILFAPWKGTLLTSGPIWAVTSSASARTGRPRRTLQLSQSSAAS